MNKIENLKKVGALWADSYRFFQPSQSVMWSGSKNLHNQSEVFASLKCHLVGSQQQQLGLGPLEMATLTLLGGETAPTNGNTQTFNTGEKANYIGGSLLNGTFLYGLHLGACENAKEHGEWRRDIEREIGDSAKAEK
jgi:hypothetical protein